LAVKDPSQAADTGDVHEPVNPAEVTPEIVRGCDSGVPGLGDGMAMFGPDPVRGCAWAIPVVSVVDNITAAGAPISARKILMTYSSYLTT